MSHNSNLRQFIPQALLVFTTLFCQFISAFAAEVPLYNRDVRPILSDKCFSCHGPDSQKRKAGLRLDIRESALEHKAIVPGSVAKSEIIKRMVSHDENEIMPPPESKLEPLRPDEIELIKRWVASGAKYEPHWSLIPVQPVKVPKQGAASPIDNFVREALKKRGLKAQPQASRETLMRRLSFDLTGLPPTPAEISDFVNDKAPNAYEKVVDRLLSSPRYGERMAVDWLDLARYADSYGFQVDREHDVWMWRDWVIKAFNENLSYDKFVTWQLAGDLLPNATDEQILATAFNRLHQQEAEGGSVEEEYRIEYVADRVQTFSTAFLGLTSECARCHDHKFDPISQKDYYQLSAYFQNIDEAGLYAFFTPSPPTPALMLLDDAGKVRRDSLQKTIAEAEKQSGTLREQKQNAFSDWLKARPAQLSLPDEIARFSFDAQDKDKLANAIKADQPAVLRGENKIVPGRDGNGVQFSGDDPVDLPIGNFARHEPFSIALWLKTPDVKERAVVFHRSRAWTDAASRGYELLIEDGKLKWSLIHFWPGNAISVRTTDALSVNQWMHIVVSSDGSSRAAGLKLYVNGKITTTEVIRDNLTKNITGGGGDNIALGERFRDRGFKGGQIDDFRVFNREVSPLEALSAFDEKTANTLAVKPDADLTEAERALLRDYYFAAIDEDAKKQRDTLKTARAEEVKFADETREIMVMRELPQPKKAYVLWRGEYNQRRDEVHMAPPSALPPLPSGAPNNRLGVARWLTAPSHPLFARVTINRFWQGLFGRGLVKTSEDFGAQGGKPSHPELLDWLALRFMQNGWDVKALLKTMVMSETYRQRSVASAQTMTDDPENEWLARGPRFRLPAEMIRDNALAAAGLLSTKSGGAPVHPYEMSEAYKPVGASSGDGLYRRSLYTKWRRTSPPPALLTFDAPRRAVCIARRERTDSPLQALILLNGIQYVEAARVLGESLYKDSGGDTSKMIEAGFMRCLSRKPDAREAAICKQLYDEQLALFKAKPQDAEALLKTGVAKRDTNIPLPEAAAATILAQALLNHDECVVKR